MNTASRSLEYAGRRGRLASGSSALNSLNLVVITLLISLSLSASSGCKTPESVYGNSLDDWTNSHEEYRGFATAAFIHATLKTEAFRRAYSDYYATMFMLKDAEKRELLAGELEENRRFVVVIVAFYTDVDGWNDLDPRKGFWEVRLEARGDRYTRPDRVTRLSRLNPTYRAMYPYYKVHYTLYELRFDRAALEGDIPLATGDKLSLVVAGAPARIRMDWTIP